MAMTKTAIEIDDEALAAAARALGTTTKKATVNAALREIASRESRLHALSELRRMGREGDYDEFTGHKSDYRR